MVLKCHGGGLTKVLCNTKVFKIVNLFQIVFWSHCTLLFNRQRQITLRVPYLRRNNIANWFVLN